MPDSPAEVKTQPRSTPPSMPPPPPTSSQGATRPPSFAPHTRESLPIPRPYLECRIDGVIGNSVLVSNVPRPVCSLVLGSDPDSSYSLHNFG